MDKKTHKDLADLLCKIVNASYGELRGLIESYQCLDGRTYKTQATEREWAVGNDVARYFQDLVMAFLKKYPDLMEK